MLENIYVMYLKTLNQFINYAKGFHVKRGACQLCYGKLL